MNPILAVADRLLSDEQCFSTSKQIAEEMLTELFSEPDISLRYRKIRGAFKTVAFPKSRLSTMTAFIFMESLLIGEMDKEKTLAACRSVQFR